MRRNRLYILSALVVAIVAISALSLIVADDSSAADDEALLHRVPHIRGR